MIAAWIVKNNKEITDITKHVTRAKQMKIDVRIETEEESELIITNHHNEEMVYLTVGENAPIIEVNIEELKLALRKIATK